MRKGRWRQSNSKAHRVLVRSIEGGRFEFLSCYAFVCDGKSIRFHKQPYPDSNNKFALCVCMSMQKPLDNLPYFFFASSFFVAGCFGRQNHTLWLILHHPHNSTMNC